MAFYGMFLVGKVTEKRCIDLVYILLLHIAIVVIVSSFMKPKSFVYQKAIIFKNRFETLSLKMSGIIK